MNVQPSNVEPQRWHRPMPGDEAGQARFDLSAWVDKLRRRWPIVAAVTLVGLLAAIGLSLLITPQYDSRTRVKINPNQRPDAVFQPDQAVAPDLVVVDSEVSIIRSNDIAEAVVRRLNLAADPQFNAVLRKGGTPPAPGGAVPQNVVDTLQGKLSVAREAGTYLVDVTYRSPDPRKAALIANTFAEEYLASTVERRTGTAGRQAKWLQDRLASLGQEVQEADARVAQFRARAGIVEGASNGTITDQQVAPLSNQLATAEAQAAAARSNLAAARGQMASGGIDAVSSVLSSPVVADLRRQRTEIVREKARVDANYGPRHPESIRVGEQLAGLDRQIAEESRRIVAGLDADARAAEASAGSLRGQLSTLRGEQASDTKSAVEADSLERQAEAKRTVYNQLAQAAQQSNQEQRSRESQGTIVERAQPALAPSWPKKPLFALLGGLAGFLLGVGAAVVVELAATGLRTVKDVETGLGIPFIVSLPLLSARQTKGDDGGTLAPPDYVAAKPMSTYAEGLRAIRNALVLGRERPAQVVAIASATPGEGKTSIATSLGRVMALSGDRVILIDCDLRLGSLGKYVPQKQGGLIEVLTGDLPLERAIVRDGASPLDILPIAEPSFDPRDLFSDAPMRDLLATLSTRYDFVVLDTPPLLAVSDARTLAALADEVVLTVWWNRTPRRAVQTALNMLEQAGARVSGAVLSMVSPKAGMVGADNPAYYYRLYRHYHQA